MWPLVGMALKATICLTGFCSLSNGAFKVDCLRCLTSSAGKGQLGNRPFVSFQNPHCRMLMRFRDTTAVKRPNRYFCFLLLGFHLPVREKWAKMYKSVSQHNYLSIFSQNFELFSENASR